jgi:hypothetical protein
MAVLAGGAAIQEVIRIRRQVTGRRELEDEITKQLGMRTEASRRCLVDGSDDLGMQ